ncbi:MAG: hypothetical protein KDA91_25315 [Planctomycetaceae bacterium]|nr:hypothetical protein [Planctomycetaceae bacterium]
MKTKIQWFVCWCLSLIVVGGAVVIFNSEQPLKATVAHGNDKFSMVTVPVAPGDPEAVFVLNHLTGVLRGAAFNNSTNTFTHHFIYNVAADFQGAIASPEPKFAIVSTQASLRSGAGAQPANGVIYIGELTSGIVIAYGFPMPRGRAAAVPGGLFRLDAFQFTESVGG